MSEYKGIKGFQVQTRTEDPVPYAQALADNPYAGAWASAANMNTARDNLASVGTTTAALGSGGFEPPLSAKSEEWDGSSWTEGNDLNTARSHFHGAGVQTSAIVVGGESPSLTNAAEEYDGTSYTTVTAYPGSKASIGALGATNTAALFMGGYPVTTESFEYDGTNYTEGGDLNTGREDMAAAGTQTAGIAIGGSPRTAVVEQYNGSAWTEVGDLNTARNGLAASHQSSYTSVLAFGGNTPGTTAATESWDGSSWTEVADLATARYDLGGSGNSNQSALAFAGGTPSRTTATELWTFSGLDPSSTPAADYADAITGDFYYNSTTGQFKTVNTGGAPIGTWGSSANLNTARGDGLGGFGTTSLAGVAGGDTGVPGDSWVANTEIYDGSSWSEVADLNTAGYFMQGTAGTSTSSITAGRRTSSNTDNVEQWNGSAWTEIAEINTARRGPQSAQPASAVSAFIIFGGYDGSTQVANTETWNGSSWTETTDMNTVKYAFGGGGAGPSDAIACGGQGPPGGNSTEIWNGSSWTEVAELNASKIEGASAGISTLLMYGGGNNPGAAGLETCEVYNGSSWSEVNDLADGENGSSCHIGTATDCFFAGGIGPNNPNAASASTEHFTAADFQIKTVTTS